MIFKPELAGMVMSGEKTVTRRLCSGNPRSPWYGGRCGYEVGQVFAVQPGRGKKRIGHAIIVGLRGEPLGERFVDREERDAEARHEGFPTFRTFQAAFAAINGEYDPRVLVWRVEFRVVRDADVPLVEQSRRQEKATGADSIPTIVRLYDQNDAGQFECCWPGCPVAWRDPVRLWRHIHQPHKRS